MSRRRVAGTLGARLRKLRDSQGRSLREVAARARINHGYLSQLERGEVVEPSPSMLHRVATAYEIPFPVLMEWAGYVETSDAGPLTDRQALALSYLGDDVSDEELEAVRTILEVIRSKRATFSAPGSLDGFLDPDDVQRIRARVLALLREADALGTIPTPLETVMDVAQLVAAGEIVLDEQERRVLRKRFGSLVDLVLGKLRGAIHLKAREIWIQPDLHEMKRRFVTAHEIGHHVLPWQRELAYLDDEARVRADVRIGFEREANQAAIELLAQGDSLRMEADDSAMCLDLVTELSAKYQVSIQATVRRLVEETKHLAALTIRFRGRTGRLGPYHVYRSRSFGSRFGWDRRTLPPEARTASRQAAKSVEDVQFFAIDRADAFVEMRTETIDTGYAVITLFTPVSTSRSISRWLRLG